MVHCESAAFAAAEPRALKGWVAGKQFAGGHASIFSPTMQRSPSPRTLDHCKHPSPTFGFSEVSHSL
eukprot:m.35699 g.35699  ORF g.35699 m.35699 type:complete len:67 (+) comp7462_c0_seq1:181-381(+)